MREAGIRVSSRRRFVVTTDSNHDDPIALNLLRQDFQAAALNQKWVTDITYVDSPEGWLYLAAIMDLSSRRVVGWAMEHRMDRSLVLSGLDLALNNQKPENCLIHHRDRGSLYASADSRKVMSKAGIIASMSRRSDGYDNAVIASF